MAVLSTAHSVALSASTPSEAIFANDISVESVNEFIKIHANAPLRTLVIFSNGGDIGAGITLGEWVWDKKLDVIVRTICASSCANYVFPAGRNKTIENDSMVVWHGSMEQKRLRRELDLYEESKRVMLSGPENATNAQRELYENKKTHYELTIALRARQAAFYSKIGVDERITRLAEDKVEYSSDACTASPALMRHFGIDHVSAPSDYAKQDYMNRNILSKLLFGQVNVFDIKSGSVVRLKMGE